MRASEAPGWGRDFPQVCQEDLESGQQNDRVTESDMRVPIRLCGEEAETDQEHLDKNGSWEQPGNN